MITRFWNDSDEELQLKNEDCSLDSYSNLEHL